MIDSLTGKHFETHLDTTIDLHPGVNTFVGESDEGKSGIVRQIKWNARNRPQGDSYRDDKLDPKKKEDKLKVTEVGINYQGSGLVVRARDGFPGGVNHYTIDNEEPLRALRTDVPDEVQEVTQMKDVNIQGQHPTEQYFLLADKPGQVAKEFNKVAGLTIMDKAKADINSQVRDCNAVIKVAKKEIETRTEDLEDSEWIPKAEKLANELKAFKKKVDKIKNDQETLSEIIKQTQNIDWQLTTFYGTEEASKELERLKVLKQDTDIKKHELNQINETIEALKSIDSALSSTTDTVKALNTLKTLKKFRSNIDIDKEKMDKINDILAKLDYNAKELKIAEMKYQETNKEYKLIRKNEACPTCGRKGK